MRFRLDRCFQILCISLICCWCAVALAQPLVKDGDRVVFLGDSITGELYYGRMVEVFFTLRYPGMKIHFYNVGYGGDTAARRLPRLPREVLSLKPTLVIICYGMNDGGYTPLTPERLDNYTKAMTGLVDGVKQAGARVVLLTPGCVDPDFDKYQMLKKANWTYNDTLDTLAKAVLELAVKENVPVFHLYPLMLDIQMRAKKDDPKFTMIPDGIHPTPAGHAVMAYALLKILGCTDQPSGLEIDTGSGKVKVDRCKIDGLKVTDKKVTFTRTDEALPTVFYPDIAPIPSYLPIIEEFNQYRFTVTGLPSPFWKLTVDGIEVGAFSNTTLAAGINLAALPGPWQMMAKRVDEVVVKEEGEFFQRWIYLSQYPAPDVLKHDLDAFIVKVDATVDTWQERRMHTTDHRTWKWTLTAVEAKH